MNFIKKIVPLCVVFSGIVSVRADVLYWQLASSQEYDANAYASVVVENNGERLRLLDGDGGDYIGRAVAASDAKEATQYASLDTYNSAEYSFFIEIIKYNDETGTWDGLTKSETMSYDSLVSNGYVSKGAMSAGSINEWTSAAANIPEPTSGLLLLVGGSLLALRRRRRA